MGIGNRISPSERRTCLISQSYRLYIHANTSQFQTCSSSPHSIHHNINTRTFESQLTISNSCLASASRHFHSPDTNRFPQSFRMSDPQNPTSTGFGGCRNEERPNGTYPARTEVRPDGIYTFRTSMRNGCYVISPSRIPHRTLPALPTTPVEQTHQVPDSDKTTGPGEQAKDEDNKVTDAAEQAKDNADSKP